MSELTSRVVVVSPHLDDAAFCLGGTLSRATRNGADIRVVTVFAGDTSSRALSGPWDLVCGFGTAGEAARSRREEDRRACAFMRCSPVWLPFADVQYERGGGEREVWEALRPELEAADTIIVPGFPLRHPDHAWLSELVVRRLPLDRRLGFYVEQPYACQRGQTPIQDAPGPDGRPLRWSSQPLRLADRYARGRACRAYWSQFRGERHLERRLMMPEVLATEEFLGWPAP